MARGSINRFFALLALISMPAFAATELASSTLSFTASGSPNWIGGSWSGTPLDLSEDDLVEYWHIELLAVSSPFGSPNYLAFSTRGAAPVSFFLASCTRPDGLRRFFCTEKPNLPILRPRL